ncbi:MAG: helix-turn-helix transcriptional regulator [Gammaproteobacteria bacterium]
MAPGALLLGNLGQSFECSHEHHCGDRCLSFHFEPEAFEEIARCVPGANKLSFDAPRVPPLTRFVPLIAEAEAARDSNDNAALEEIAFRIAGATLKTILGAGVDSPALSRRDEQRVTTVLRHIGTAFDENLSLADLAGEVFTSRYHFLRIFQRAVGQTPRQYILRTRLQRALQKMRLTNDNISTIALEVGFEDISTFDRFFRRVLGVSPSNYRKRARAANKI